MNGLRLCVWIGLVVGTGCSADTGQPDNLLLISIDTWRADTLGAAGHATIQTPHLDRLAAAGVLADTALTHVPVTLPSHATMFTGLLPPALGLHDNAPFALNPSIPTLPAILQHQGFWTGAAIGGQPLASGCGLERGFDLYLDPPRADQGELLFAEWNASEVTDRALKLLDRSPADVSQFLFVHYFDPHYPYQPPGVPADWNPTRRYQAEVEFVDQQLGRLLEAIESSAAEWLVLITSDHGEGLGQHGELTHGYQVYETTLEVPWILAAHDRSGWHTPSAFRGRPIPLVAHVDLLPTLLGLLGVEHDAPGPGFDISRQPRRQPAVYVESLLPWLHFGWAQTTGLRSDFGLYLWTGRLDGPLPTTTYARAEPGPGELVLLRQKSADWESEHLRWRQTLRRLRDAKPSTPASDPTLAPLVSLGYVGVANDASMHQLLSLENNATNPSALGRSDTINTLLRAIQAFGEGRTNAAYSSLDKLVEDDPENPTARFFHAKVCIELATREHSRQQAMRAAEGLRHVLNLRPGYPGARSLQAKAAGLVGNFELGLNLARALVAAEPAVAEHHQLLGALYLESHSVDREIPNAEFSPRQGYKTLLRALALDPSDEQLRAAIARGLNSIGTSENGHDWVRDCQHRLAEIPRPCSPTVTGE